LKIKILRNYKSQNSPFSSKTSLLLKVGLFCFTFAQNNANGSSSYRKICF